MPPTDQVTDRIERQVTTSCLQLQRNNLTSTGFPRSVCERDTPTALLLQSLRPWTTVWFDHVQRTQGISVELHTQQIWRVPQASPLCQSREIQLETTRLSRLQPGLPHFLNSHCFSREQRDPSGVASDDDEGAGVIATCAETASGHDFAQCGGFVIFPHFWHRSLSLFAFLPLPPLPLDLSDPLCENLHLSPRAQVPLA